MRLGGLQSQDGTGKKQDSISKITRAKSAGGMAEVVEHLSSKCKTLSSNSSTTKNKIKYNKNGDLD
jgi:hypothetical protein